MQLQIELAAWTFHFEAIYELEDRGIGHYEFWGHKEYNEDWQYALKGVQFIEAEDPDGEQYDKHRFPELFIDCLADEYWDSIEEQFENRL